MKCVEVLDRGMEIQARTVPLHFRGAWPFISLKTDRLMGVLFARAPGMWNRRSGDRGGSPLRPE